MVVKLAGTMHTFGCGFLIAAMFMAVGAFVAAMKHEKDAAIVAKELFSKCLLFGVLLWIIAWLIS